MEENAIDINETTSKEDKEFEQPDVEIFDSFENFDVLTDLVFEGKEDVNLRDIDYMCNYISKYEGCENCILNSGRVCGFALLLKKFGTTSSLNNNILNWLNDNPPTSFLMDIKEKMPNVDIDDYNIPNFCVQSIYGKDCCECLIEDSSKFDKKDILCRKCWRTPMEEEIRKDYH
jgi:hypothetical protein